MRVPAHNEVRGCHGLKRALSEMPSGTDERSARRNSHGYPFSVLGRQYIEKFSTRLHAVGKTLTDISGKALFIYRLSANRAKAKKQEERIANSVALQSSCQ